LYKCARVVTKTPTRGAEGGGAHWQAPLTQRAPTPRGFSHARHKKLRRFLPKIHAR
jgi:hypothetical protein